MKKTTSGITITLRLIAIPLLLVAMPLMTLPAPVSADSQQWYLTNDPIGFVGDDIMSKTAPNIACDASNPPWRLVGKTVWTRWRSANAAECDVSFGDGTWTVNLAYRNGDHPACPTGTLYAEVISISPFGKLERILAQGSTGITPTGENEKRPIDITCYDNNDTAQTVPEGHRLGLRLRYVHGCNPYLPDVIRVFFLDDNCRSSVLTSPPSDAGYPVPEVPAFVLLGLGLGVLGVLILINRKRQIPFAS